MSNQATLPELYVIVDKEDTAHTSHPREVDNMAKALSRYTGRYIRDKGQLTPEKYQEIVKRITKLMDVLSNSPIDTKRK